MSSINSWLVNPGLAGGSPRVRNAVRVALLLSAATVVLPQVAGAKDDKAAGDAAAAVTASDVTVDTAAGADAPANSSDAAPALTEVVVSGSRVVRDGYQAPTPVSVVTAEDMQSFASNNLADSLNSIPAVAGSTTPASMQANASSGNAGINAIDLRNIGTNRTLVMMDGQRIVASSSTGLVDINTIPQELVKRVEVVTGGASASWGSDAVGGVVNFILDHNYTGLKATMDFGTTSYWDNKGGKFTLTGGHGFADGRGHVLFSAHFSHEDPVIFNTRPWNLQGWQFVINNAYGTGAGQSTSVPQRLLLPQIATAAGVIGGIVTSGPLMGTAFGAGGVPYQFQYGSFVNGTQDMQGGPMWQAANINGKWGGVPLASRMDELGGFLEASYDLTDTTKVTFTMNHDRSRTANWAFSNEDYGSICLKSGNAFIPASVQAAMNANGAVTPALADTTSCADLSNTKKGGSPNNVLTIGTMHPDLDLAEAMGDRTVNRYSLAFDGSLGESWKWNAYYQYGISKQAYATPGMWNTSNLAKAEDAVVNPATGATVCRVTLTNPSDPCVPYNPLGIGVNTAAAVAYVEGNGQTQQRLNYNQQNVVSASISGTPLKLWAGDLSVATGIEWRKEAIGGGWVDPTSLLGQWWAGNSRPTYGNFNVKEGFIETVLPLAKDLPFAKSLELQSAVREEDYSTAGDATAWKAGLTWKPFDSLTVRASRSRDIRAPNLIELYSAGVASAPFIIDPWHPEIPSPGYSISQLQTGNLELRPEKANSWGVGLVFQPEFVAGFGASVDYWETNISDAIGSSLKAQQIVDNCYAGQSDYCGLIDWAGGVVGSHINTVRSAPVNNSSAGYRGIDYEASYRFMPGFIPGNVALRLMATHNIENATWSNGIKTDVVGNNSGNVPNWRWTASVNWSLDPWKASIAARGISAGVYDNRFIVCSTSCPASVAPNYTVNYNHIPGAIYFDGSLSRSVMFGESKAEFFVNVRNLLNKDPAVVGQYGSYADTESADNAGLYDVMGRVVQVGVRVEF